MPMALLSLLALIGARALRAETPLPRLALAGAEVVVVGRVTGPAALMGDHSSRHGWVNAVPVQVTRVYKGELEAPIVHLYQPNGAFNVPNDGSTAQVQSREWLFPLSRLAWLPTDTLMLAHPSFVYSWTPSRHEALEQELAWQLRVTHAGFGLPSRAEVDHYARVGALIREMGSESTARRAYEALISLGPDAVPAIILQMDDRRRFPPGRIMVPNSSGYESIAHYGPKLIVEALAAILSRLSDRSFNMIYNGGTDEQHVHEVACWRVYLADMWQKRKKTQSKAVGAGDQSRQTGQGRRTK